MGYLHAEFGESPVDEGKLLRIGVLHRDLAAGNRPQGQEGGDLVKILGELIVGPTQPLDALSQMAVPMAVKGVPEDIAKGVLWLASDESRYVTGAELVIDGGLMLR